MWRRVADELPPAGEWVVVAEEDDAGWAYGLGEYVDGDFVPFDHGGIEPSHWVALPAPPERSVPDLFDELVTEVWR